MCLIATFTEQEKLNQVQKVQHLMTLPLDTEEKKKNFLYNLSYMNNMVVKGYKKERTEVDYVIYSTKDKALNLLINVMPDRCHQQGTCLYVYAGGRQYSYHFIVNMFTGHNKALYDFEWDYCCKHNRDSSGRWEFRKKVEWDGIIEGYALSDAEYRQQYAEVVARRRNREKQEQEDAAKYEAELNRNARIYLLRGIKVARQRNKEIRKHNALFWKMLENRLTKAQKRTKAYIKRDSDKLFRLYGKSLGLTWRDLPRRLEDSPVMIWGDSEYDYGWQRDYEAERIWHRMMDIYLDYKHKGKKKYII